MAKTTSLTINISKFHVLALGILLIGVVGFVYTDRQGVFKELPPDQRAINYMKKNTGFTGDPTKVEIVKNDNIKNNKLLEDNQAADGDVLLIYSAHQKAVLWRPSNQKIINILDTTRSDGLDISSSASITLLHLNNDSAKARAEQIKQNILSNWPELKDKIKISPIESGIAIKEFIGPGDQANENTMNDITVITEKVGLPISTVKPKQLPLVDSTILVYVGK